MVNRVWVITGTSSGLGLALAQYVLSQGDKVVATVHSPAKFPKELETLGAAPVFLDLFAPDEEIKHVAGEALRVYGHVDVLVNNAGTLKGGVQPIEEVSMEATRNIFQVNFFGLLAFAQPFVSYFRESKAGHIINISSMGSIIPSPSSGGYGATKAALNSISHSLYAELAPYGVRVTTVLSGYFPSNIFAGAEQPLSPIYTDPETQGYDLVRRGPEAIAALGWCSDTSKFAARVYEIVTDTGIAKDVGVGRHNIHKIPIGLDAGTLCERELEKTLRDFAMLKPLWSSTNMSKEE